MTLRQQAFRIIEDLRRRVHRDCGRVVSCADITAIAARDSVFFVSLRLLVTILSIYWFNLYIPLVLFWKKTFKSNL